MDTILTTFEIIFHALIPAVSVAIGVPLGLGLIMEISNNIYTPIGGIPLSKHQWYFLAGLSLGMFVIFFVVGLLCGG